MKHLPANIIIIKNSVTLLLVALFFALIFGKPLIA